MNRTSLPMSLFAAVLLVGCQRTPPAEPLAAEPAATPAPAPASTAPVASSDADWQGYGAAQLGIDVDQLRAVWGSELQGDAAADGKATVWRVGLPPQVDYVEGCG
jgi:hypothetical protein